MTDKSRHIGNIKRHVVYIRIGQMQGDGLHPGIGSAAGGIFKFLEHCYHVVRFLPGETCVALFASAVRAVTLGAGGAVDFFSALALIGRAAAGRTVRQGSVVKGEVDSVIFGKAAAQVSHGRVVAPTVTEALELVDDVNRILAGQIGRQRLNRDAVDAVTDVT